MAAAAAALAIDTATDTAGVNLLLVKPVGAFIRVSSACRGAAGLVSSACMSNARSAMADSADGSCWDMLVEDTLIYSSRDYSCRNVKNNNNLK
jgi:hypothetical protein